MKMSAEEARAVVAEALQSGLVKAPEKEKKVRGIIKMQDEKRMERLFRMVKACDKALGVK